MNKKLIRLTESDLHRIVKKSVNRIINEIGDMGLGFDLLNEKDEKAYNESANKEKDNESNSKEN